MPTEKLSLIVRKRIRVNAQRVFEAWTTPQQLLAWWGPSGVVCTRAEIDLRVGGKYVLGNQMPNEETILIEGEFLVVEPPERLVYTWKTQGPGHTEQLASSERVTVTFSSFGEETEIVVVHENILTPELHEGHSLGWSGCLDGLHQHFVESGSR